MSQLIDRTADTSPTAIQDVGVNHSGTDVFVSKQFLHGANIVAIFKKMRGKRVPQAMAARRLSDTRFEGCLPHCSLEDRLVDVVLELFTGDPVGIMPWSWENPVPAPLPPLFQYG